MTGAQATTPTVFKNVDVFDGTGDKLIKSQNILVQGGEFSEITSQPIEIGPEATVIEGNGRVLMPGLIDCHYHAILSQPISKLAMMSQTYIGIGAKRCLEDTLQRGFTTVRDALGSDFGIVLAEREGQINGPRIYPSGKGISQTGGHGDMRFPNTPHPAYGAPNHWDQLGAIWIADGVPEVLRVVREELRKGSTQIKIMGSGGVASPSDPIHTVQYTPEEVSAAVTVATNWGTYVHAHAYTSASIQQCIKNGVKCIEHANLIDQETANMVADRQGYIVPNLVAYWSLLQVEDAPEYMREKNKIVWAGAEQSLEHMKKAGVKVAIGTDLIGPEHANQSREFALRSKVFSNAEILRQATSVGAQLVAESGPLNPYGRLGVIEKGAVADLLLVEKNPLEDVSVLEDAEKNLAVIMKAGVLVKHNRAR